MPELPEVESARRSLRPLIGRRVQDVRVLRPQAVRTHSAAALARTLRGKRIKGVLRRGKNLLIRLDGLVLRFHFKLWGLVRLHAHPLVGDRETAVVLTFGDASTLEFRELQLSELGLHRAGEVARIPAIAELGPEPFGPKFTWAAFRRRLAGARGAVRTALTDQSRFAGIGNLWAHEILHRARIAPARPLGRLRPAELRALYDATKAVLAEAVRQGGEPEFVDAQGGRGRFPLAVYGREGQPCPRDGAPVRRERLGGRPSFWCARCQK